VYEVYNVMKYKQCWGSKI